MKNQAFHFEIEDILTQFITAFDDCVIKRFKGRESKDQITVAYKYAPKQTVLFDIVNKGKSTTLPAVAFNMASITRDASRVFNKIDGFYYPSGNPTSPAAYSAKVGVPVPVNISVNMSIIGKFQTDVEQIISNFAAYANPYIVLVWKIPSAFNLSQTYEIRSEVEWSGSISLDYPDEQGPNALYRIVANTGFTIKTWLFPAAPTDLTKNIFFIDANFYATRTLSGNPMNMSYARTDAYEALSAANFNGFTETVHISAAPTITNIYYANSPGIGKEVFENFTINSFNSGGVVTIFGKRLLDTTYVALCSNNLSTFFGTLTTFNFDYYDSVNCYILNDYQIQNDNIITLNLPSLTASGDFNVVIINPAGYDTTDSAYGTHFIV